LIELDNTIKLLPNGKASGPSKISYEVIKHLPDNIKEGLVILFNLMLQKGYVPHEWKHALLYPILKPKPFEGNLNNTRPIVLLETLRKLLTKIINNRLNRFLSTYNILQYNNQAGVNGTSTIEIIYNIHTIMEHHKTTKQPLYIMLQDLSKLMIELISIYLNWH
jgi:hypothetical protein